MSLWVCRWRTQLCLCHCHVQYYLHWYLLRICLLVCHTGWPINVMSLFWTRLLLIQAPPTVFRDDLYEWSYHHYNGFILTHSFYIWHNRLLLVSAKHFKTRMPLHLWKHHSKKHIFLMFMPLQLNYTEVVIVSNDLCCQWNQMIFSLQRCKTEKRNKSSQTWEVYWKNICFFDHLILMFLLDK